jgi:predicted PurR-regulated permease PerM
MELSHRNIRKILFIVIVSIIIFLGLQNMGKVVQVIRVGLGLLMPFFLGGAMAFILNVPLQLIEKKVLFSNNRIVRKIKRPVSILLSILLASAVLFLVVVLLIPQLAETIEILTVNIPKFFRNIPSWADRLYDRFPDLEQWLNAIEVDWNSVGNKILDVVRKSTSAILGSTFSAISYVFGVAFNLIIAFVFAINILASKERLAQQAKRLLYAYLPEVKADRAVYIGSLTNKVFFNFVAGQLTEAVILGLLCFIGMLIFRFPFAAMASVLIGFTALIPLFGAFIGTGVAAFIILMADPMKALWFVLFIIILQQFEGNVIYPRVVGSSVGLPAMWVMLAVTLGGSTMGIPGMLLFVPIFSVLYTLVKEAVRNRLDLKRIDRRKLT